MRKPSANAPAAEPVAPAELLELFRLYGGFRRIALAVSGGSDSLALLHLSLAWRDGLAEAKPDFVVLTVDHGLRPEAAAEAQTVAAEAAKLGLECRVLTRTPTSATSGLQASARTDRYRLLVDAARAWSAEALVTAHTLDDQAETVLMRLARGSGVDGLSAMAQHSQTGGLPLLRPLLGLSKARLQASLRARGVTWLDDPSNLNLDFERPRLRAAMPSLAAGGLHPAALARSARRLTRARAALDNATSDAFRSLVSVNPSGYLSLLRPGFEALPEEIRLRLLARLLAALGAAGQDIRLERLERLVAELGTASSAIRSLMGCIIEADPDTVLLFREPGRDGLPRVTVKPGETILWDRRFRICLAPDAGPVIIRAPEPADMRGLLASATRTVALSRAAVLAAPAAWRDNQLIAMPVVGLASRDVDMTCVLTVEDVLTATAADDSPREA